MHKDPRSSYDLDINWRAYEFIHNTMSFLYDILNYQIIMTIILLEMTT